MNKEKTAKLFERFPFFHPESPITESLMGFGFECGDGWFQLIWDLCLDLEKEGSVQKVVQVKEKFGTLRFYCQTSSFEAEELIEIAEDLSTNICERCGENSVLSQLENFGKISGWISNICDKCKEKK
jgi:hypothetical protein